MSYNMKAFYSKVLGDGVAPLLNTYNLPETNTRTIVYVILKGLESIATKYNSEYGLYTAQLAFNKALTIRADHIREMMTLHGINIPHIYKSVPLEINGNQSLEEVVDLVVRYLGLSECFLKPQLTHLYFNNSVDLIIEESVKSIPVVKGGVSI